MKKLLLLAAAALSVSSAAQAALIPTLEYVDPVEYYGSNLYLWSYTLTITGGSDLSDVVSKFVIYDFAGFTPFSFNYSNVPQSFDTDSPINWSGLAELETNTITQAGGVIPNPVFPDDPTVENIVFTYGGPEFQNPGTVPVTVLGFHLLSTFGGTTAGGFGGRTIEPDNFASFNQGHVEVPTFTPLGPGMIGSPPGPGDGVGNPCVPGIVCVPPICLPGTVCGDSRTPVQGGVPESGSWALMTLGCGGVGALLRRRQRFAATA